MNEPHEVTPQLTVIVPFLNEQGTLVELIQRVTTVFETAGKTFELVMIDDGSNDGSRETVAKLAKADSRIRLFSMRRNVGKSAALNIGFEKARGEYVFTMDADLQDDPDELPALLAKLEEGWDLVSGWKQKRYDPISKTIPSKLFNWVTGKAAGIRLHDFNCGLKIYRSEVVKDLSIYGEMHRFIPVLAHLRGFRVTELAVQHHPRKWGKTKFGAARFLHGFLDLLTVVFLQRYTRRPLHLFGSIGVVVGLLGAALGLYLTVLKLMGEAIGHRPLLLLAVLFILVGVQLVSLGLLGEMVAAQQGEERHPLRKSTEI